MKKTTTSLLVLLLSTGLLLTNTSWAAEIPWATPEEVGMSSERLDRINTTIQRHIDAGDIQGAVTAVARRGKLVHFEAHGLMDEANNRPMQEDSIFIMMSSSKPVLGVAAMMMIEEGLIRPEDPVSKYLPEFADMQVAVLKEPVDENISPRGVDRDNLPEHRLVPAHREITIHDLLTHTSGLGTGSLGSTLQTPAPFPLPADRTLASEMARYASGALDFQPGDRWAYSGLVGLDVVARIVEIVSGQPYDEFIKDRIFDPLDMNNTWFNVPEEYRDRRVVIRDRDMSPFFDNTTNYFSASAGLNSTAEDYLKFEQMLVNGGELFGNRLLSPRSIRMMGSDQTAGLYNGIGRVQGGLGFGYTVYVTQDPIAAGARRGAGAFGWMGAFGTRTWTDPEEELTGVLFLQQPHGRTQLDFENAVQQAIID
ncbi:MAG TPA: beta-lactamase [Gammaproteobacteria bacterium]|jgi:CubicO group peptidase (beta-lactamase class C family)|nr:serine hydrolase domain-containing protein [Gammaproteobacteria bacterium]MDP6731498.1 serine hydrolase domain-containing protein [Gammaproteobacteria bacterium]HAJ76400.1 beta-lactamase [Gammaproteobacteria bacterium]|tara:strand:- start:3646 stop:4917 length:1272 start_codon:yes stop_codon:yes gene_type:complete